MSQCFDYPMVPSPSHTLLLHMHHPLQSLSKLTPLVLLPFLPLSLSRVPSVLIHGQCLPPVARNIPPDQDLYLEPVARVLRAFGFQLCGISLRPGRNQSPEVALQRQPVVLRRRK